MAEKKEPENKPTAETADVTGEISNRAGGAGTAQEEPRAEDLPIDAKIAPVAEQLAPNSAPTAVGAVQDPKLEGQKVVTTDMSDGGKFVAPSSQQKDEAKDAAPPTR